ncbi:MAG: ABC transporter permease [Bifidobacteriaceae bacterium]|nr:ABC transporter permease [Bifidobacteriaceae bacterium]
MSGGLLRKLMRDLLQAWRQFFAVFLMALLSALCYVGLEGAWHGLEVSLDRFAESNSLADGWIQARTVTPAQLDQFADLSGVERVEAATQGWVTDQSDNGGYLRVESATDQTLSRPAVTEGDPVEPGKTGLWLDRDYAEAHDLQVGSEVTIDAGGQTETLDVLGLVLSPDEVYFTGTPALGAPEPSKYGYGYLGSETLGAGPSNLVRFAGDAEAVAKAAPGILGTDYQTVQSRATRASVATAFDRVAQIKNLSYLFCGLFILLALLAMFTAIRRIVAMQRLEIATLQAMGFARSQIRLHFLAFGLASGGVGAAVGALAAPAISLFVLGTQKAMFALPDWTIAYTPLSGVVFLLIVAACCASALLAVAKPLTLTPAEGLRQAIGRARHVGIERLAGIWNRFSVGARWALRDSMLNRVRFLMGIIAAVGCMMLLFAGFGVSDSMYDQVKQVFAVERTHEQRLTLIPGAPLDELPEGTQLLQETIVRADSGFEDLVLTVVGSGDSMHLTADGKAAPGAAGVYATAAMAKRLAFAAGDELKLEIPAADATVVADLTAIIDTSTPQGFYVTQSYWEDQGLTFTPTTALTPAGQRSDSDQAAQVLDRSLQVDNGNELVKGLESIFMLIRVFAIILAVVVLYSLGSLAFTERTRDYATLSVLGFTKADIRRLVGTENAVMTAIGLGIGLPVGYWFLTVYVTMFDTRDTAYYPSITWQSVFISMAVTALSALSTTLFLRRRVRSIEPVEALKGLE